MTHWERREGTGPFMWRVMGESHILNLNLHVYQTLSLTSEYETAVWNLFSYWMYRMPDWIDQFPMHKCACEGDEEGVRRCVKIGVSPDERDTDSWTALHYACW